MGAGAAVGAAAGAGAAPVERAGEPARAVGAALAVPRFEEVRHV